MNMWATYLTDLPPSLLQAIARANRVSVPRGASPATRLERLRIALCRAATVRATWASLDEPARALMQALAQRPHGISAPDLTACGGLLRPPSALRRDPRPQSLSEQLLLLGWLLPRPAAPHHPPRYLVPPELRGWLPQPLAVAGSGPVPTSTSPMPPALQVTWAILLICAAAPLPIRADGRLRAAALRQLARRLTSMPAATITALSHLLMPLLHTCNLLAPHGTAAALAPAARAFADRATADQLAQLRAAWLAHPHPDPWASALLLRDHGLDWPALRRRLCAWAEELPTDQLLDPAGLADALTAAYGPLADSTTHGLRPVPQAPWHAPRAAAVWHAALAGPLAWFGLVAWIGGTTTPDAQVYRTTTPPAPGPPHYVVPQTLHLPYGTICADLLDLMPFLEWQTSNDSGWLLAWTPRSLARARTAGYAAHQLTPLLTRVVGPPPPEWDQLPSPPEVQIVYRAVALSADPNLLYTLGQDRAVARQIAAHVAAGVALVHPDREASFAAALAERGVAAYGAAPPRAEPPATLSPAERALLVAACRAYQQQVGAAGHIALQALIDRLGTATSPAPLWESPAMPEALPVDPAQIPALLRAAIARREALQIHYRNAGGVDSTRLIRPLRLERHAEHWYLVAFCTQAAAERTFRTDRMRAIARVVAPLTAPRRTGYRPTRRRGDARRPRTGFFRMPPNPPSGSPLVRIWLSDD